MRRVRVLTLLVLLVTLLGPMAGRVAQAASPAIQITPNAILAGTSDSQVAVTGTGFTPTSQATVQLDSTAVGTATTDGSGAFGGTSSSPAVTFLSPALEVGQHAISVADTQSLSVTQALYVVSLTFSTTTAPVGEQVTLAGQGFLASQPVTVQLAGITLLRTRADAHGAFGPQAFTVPAVSAGQQPLVVHSGQGVHPLAVTTMFTREPAATLTLEPSALHAGATFTVSGAHYPKGATLRIMLDGQLLATVTSSATGILGPLQLRVPQNAAPGSHTVRIRSQGNRVLASAGLTVLRPLSASLSPSSGPPGMPVTLTGSGFQPGETIVISITHSTVASATAGTQGELNVTFTLPAALSPGVVQVQATGQVSQHGATATYTVLPASLALSATSGPIGIQVTAGGQNFAPNEAVSLTLAGKAMVSTVSTSSGAWNASFTVPTGLTPGALTVTASGAASHASASATFTLVAPQVTAGSTTVLAGSSLVLTGAGYAPGERVVISVPGGYLGAVNANAQGGFAVSVTIPVSQAPGALTITATGDSSRQPAQVTVTISAAARIFLNTGTVQGGSTVTVTGLGFAPGEPVAMTIPGYSLSTVIANAQGNFAVRVAIPEITLTNDVQVMITASGQWTRSAASATLQVTPGPARLAVRAESVFTGGQFSVDGGGFHPGELVVISVPGQVLTSVAANAQGTFTAAVTLPATVQPATMTITATGQQSQHAATATLRVVARPKGSLTLAPASGIVGSDLEIRGTGYSGGETIDVTVDGQHLAWATADANGAFSTRLTVPPTFVGGAHILGAVGAQSRYTSEATFTVLPNVRVTPETMTAGAEVTISGSGYAPREQISLSLSPGGAFATALTDEHGAFTLTSVLPVAEATGSVRVTAVGLMSRTSAAALAQITTPGKVGGATWYFAAGRTDAGFSEQIAVLNPNTRPVMGTITLFYGSQQTLVRSFELRPAARGTFDIGQFVGATRVSVMVQANLPIAVALTQDRAGEDMMANTGVSAPAYSWYMAEGYTGLTFREELDLLNPGTQAAHVHVVWPLFNGRPPVTYDLLLAPRSRLTIPVNTYVDRASHATVVTSDQPMVASRTMLFGTRQQGAHAAAGVTRGSQTLYFAEGSTANGFEEYLTILNPQSSGTAHVTANFFDRQGHALGTQTIAIEAMHRGTIKVNDLVRNAAIATVLYSDLPVVAERAMYFGAPNGDRADGTVVFGQSELAGGWAFAAGDTRAGHAEFALLFNPRATACTIQAIWYADSGKVVEKTFTLDGSTRMNIDVTLQVPELPRGYHGLILRSVNGAPFIAEQAMYGNFMANGSATLGTPIG